VRSTTAVVRDRAGKESDLSRRVRPDCGSADIIFTSPTTRSRVLSSGTYQTVPRGRVPHSRLSGHCLPGLRRAQSSCYHRAVPPGQMCPPLAKLPPAYQLLDNTFANVRNINAHDVAPASSVPRDRSPNRLARPILATKSRVESFPSSAASAIC
jgi:hypothetical protein